MPATRTIEAADFWRPWAVELSSFEDVERVLALVHDDWIATRGRLFAWRGVVNADWPLHSSLYRRLAASASPGRYPKEQHLQQWEGEVLKRAHQWGLHYSDRGRLPILAQLATLQHFGAPTRLIDVTLNAFIGVWFAVEERFENGRPVYEDIDGRLFAVDISDRLINEDDERRGWEDDLSRPWKGRYTPNWRTEIWAWKPPPLGGRIAAQQGAFLLGGVPIGKTTATTGDGRTRAQQLDPHPARDRFAVPKGPSPHVGKFTIDEIRQCTSLALRLHKADPRSGISGKASVAGRPAYTFRIKAEAKASIRLRLNRMFGYTHATIYPDYPGFAQFSTPDLRSE